MSPSRTDHAKQQEHHDYYVQLARDGKLRTDESSNYTLAKQREVAGEVHPLPMTCEMAKKMIDEFFAMPSTSSNDNLKALREDLISDVIGSHLTVGSTVGKHNVSCQSCWDYYQSMKRKHCGG